MRNIAQMTVDALLRRAAAWLKRRYLPGFYGQSDEKKLLILFKGPGDKKASFVLSYKHDRHFCFTFIIEKRKGEQVITYDRLWQTMKERNISQYDLYTTYKINRSQLHRLRHNQNVEVNTIDKLCNILHCRVEDIMEHFEDDNVF